MHLPAPFLVALPQVGDRIAAEPVEQGVGQYQRHHGLPNHRRRGYRADVAAFDVSRPFLAGGEVH